ncbi:GLUG motif-containing protein [Natronospora cellulosivora (SeqCode)]
MSNKRLNEKRFLVFLMILSIVFISLGCDSGNGDSRDPSEKTFYTLTVRVEGEGTVWIEGTESVEPQVEFSDNFQKGTSPNINIETEDGFIKWQGDVNENQSYDTEIIIEIDKDKSVTAFFQGEGLFDGGSGTESDPYLIANSEQLDIVSYNLDKHFKQVKHIDLIDFNGGIGWNPIGSQHHPFSGSFDGGGYTIKNLNINNSKDVGLFGVLDFEAILRNIILEEVQINATTNSGGLVGVNNGTIENSSSKGEIRGDGHSGVLVANNQGTIINSYAKGISIGELAGGLVGYNNGKIINTYAKVDVDGETHSGGLVGLNIGKVNNSYSVGLVNETINSGGLIGQGNKLSVENSYYDLDNSGQNDEEKGIPISEEGMKQRDTYNDWDFDSVWAIDEGVSYPYLQWQ